MNVTKPKFLDRLTPPTMFSLVIMTAVSALPMNMFLSSMPNMAAEFGVTYADMTLAITIYLAMTALVQLIIGPLSDLIGRRPVVLGALLISISAAIGSGMADSYLSFMLFRCLQASAMTGTVLSRAVVRDMVAREDAASKIGYVTMGMAIVPMLSIPLGGVLEEAFGWRSIFYFITGASLVTWIILFLDQGETLRHRAASFGDHFRAYPTLLKSVRFWCYVAILALTVSMYTSFIAVSPNIGASVYDLSPSRFALYLTAMPFGYMMGNFLAGRYSKRFGIQWMMNFGGWLLLISFVILFLLAKSFPTVSTYFFLTAFVMAVGNGMVIPNTTAALLEVNPDLAGSASGLSGATMTLFGAILGSFSSYYISDTRYGSSLIALLIVIAVLQMAFTIWVGRIEKIRRA